MTKIKKRSNRISNSDKIFNTINLLLCIIVLFATIYPLYLVIIASISSPEAVLRGDVIFKPVDISFQGYESILGYKNLLRSYINSIFYTVTGTAISIVVTLCAAYALSRPSFPGKGVIGLFLVFTMFFTGGLIPTFLVMKEIGFYDNYLMLILNGCVSVWNLMVARTFIQTTIPNELYEASTLDGASHFNYFFSIVLPLCSTIIAVLCVYYGVAKWNDYFTGLVYIRNEEWLPLQTVLRGVLASLQIDVSALMTEDDAKTIAEAVRTAQVAKYCIIVISSGPVILLYVFMQKYFVKGVMIGSIKG